MSEAAITKTIMDWLREQPDVFAWKTIGSAFTRRGIPDICGNVGIAALYLEVKTEKGRLSRSQSVLHKKISKTGGIVWVVRSVEDAQRAVDTLRVLADEGSR